MRIDHLGIATRDADAAVDTLGPLMDAAVAHEEAADDLRFVFLELENGYFELLEPRTDGTPIDGFLDERGPGIHHVAIRVPDLEAAMADARDAGQELIDETPRPGAWGHEVAFVHPRTTGGILLEFVG